MRPNKFLIPLALMVVAFGANSVPVKVTMNAISTTMSLKEKNSENPVDVGSPVNKVYAFDAPEGEYVLTAYATDGTTVNGTIELDIANRSETQEFVLITNTAYVSNKNEDGTTWSVDNGDYTLDVIVNTREGVRQTITIGNSTTAERNTFLAFNGNSYNVAFIPSDKHVTEGYTTLYKGGTLTFNVTVSGKIPMASDYSITIPSEAELTIGLKFFHFINFTKVEPKSVKDNGATKTITYRLADGQIYNYRTWMNGGLTQAGYFTMSVDEAKCPAINFTEADYSAFSPSEINHTPQSNKGYETGDIFVNINPEGHLRMNVGDEFDAHAMRTWELTDNSTNNYFMEPDFHYTVVDLDGKPSTDVIEIDNQDPSSPWAKIRAIGNGTAIVLVTYDAIGVNYYNGVNKTSYLGGEYWGAIWPENTGVYVVTVGEAASSAVPNMLINEEYNESAKKLAGNYVDAEHDVFYYLDSQEGAYYTFSPLDAADVTIAYPSIGENRVSYTGFSNSGVTKNNDGSYTLLLKEGRQIVKVSDVSGRAAYQVMTAKKCHLDITNTSRPGSRTFQPGDKITLQYSGLFHPANKLAGIYNMSAYVTYNGIPNGTSLILGSGQYTFGSAASAQAVTVAIPLDHDVTAQPELVMDKGVIQVNGYGDPIGNHRTISPVAGRSPNFTAVAHKTYFGAIPDIHIPLSAYKTFDIRMACNVPDADITVTFEEQEIEPNEEGVYSGTFGNYDVTAVKDGYRCYRHTFSIDDNAEGMQTFNIKMEPLGNGWDGITLTQPEEKDGVYQISNGAELAWLASHVNNGNAVANACLISDIDLANYEWTPIGMSAAKYYGGRFDGNGHKIEGLYINNTAGTYQALFGVIKEATVCDFSLYGSVTAKQYVAGIVASIQNDANVDRCGNYADVKGSSTYVGGVSSTLFAATSSVTNSFNAGKVSGTTNCGGVVGYNQALAVMNRVFNVGEVTGTAVGACIGGATAKTNISEAYAIVAYQITDGQTLVSPEQMVTGEIAWLLGEPFGQTIGADSHPVINGENVFKVIYTVINGQKSTAEPTATLYTNAVLPSELNGEQVNWWKTQARMPPETKVCLTP